MNRSLDIVRLSHIVSAHNAERRYPMAKVKLPVKKPGKPGLGSRKGC